MKCFFKSFSKDCKMIKVKMVGEGAYGKVYRATSDSPHEGDKKTSYAVKRNIMESEVDFAGNMREMDILLRLKKHPNIVNVEHVICGEPFMNQEGALSPVRDGYKDDILHFVLECADTDLHNFIYSSLQLTDIKPMLVEALLGLEYMHANNVLHRDIKPGNLLLFFDVKNRNLPPMVKLCDFGLSIFTTFQEPQTPRMVTPWYRAPEIAMGKSDYNHKIDVWSMGCVIYQIMTKKGFIESRDDDMEILAQILKQLPTRLPPSETKKLKEKYGVRLPRGRRRAFRKDLFPEIEDIQDFETEVGPVSEFVDLVEWMLQFFPENRPTVTDVLNHSFFSEFADKIASSRAMYLDVKENNCFQVEDSLITIFNTKERKWASRLAIYFYNEHLKNGIRWYKHRILFQAIDLFDRYLEYTLRGDQTPLPSISAEKLFAEQVQIELRFITCLYISIKYFATIETPISYIDISEELFSIEEAQEFAQKFERELLEKVFQYLVYRPTIFECADTFEEKLGETDIRNLLWAYGNCSAKDKIPLRELYQELRTVRIPTVGPTGVRGPTG